MRNICRTVFCLLAAIVFITAGSVTAQDQFVYERPEKNRKSEEPAKAPAELAPLRTFVVNSDGDGADATPGDGICETAAGNGICTLRAAVGEANALAGDDAITFEPGISQIQVNGQIQISSNLTIIGPGANLLTIASIAAQGTTSRVFNVGNFAVSIHGLKITGGFVTGSGGGILNSGSLSLTNVAVDQNRATSTGGGIRSTNTLLIRNSAITANTSTASTSGGISFAGTNLLISRSTISGNTSSGNGGGINISATVSATIENSTISGNTAGGASGGLFMNRGTINNSTISGNTATGALATEGGGGIRIQAGVNSVDITSTTITDNSAPNADAGSRSGIWHETGTLTLKNNIVAANTTQDIQFTGGTLTNGGYNLIGRNTSVETQYPAGLPNGTDWVGTGAAPLDPLLAPLGLYGGPTQTHALFPGSVAINTGDDLVNTLDQRGYIRPWDAVPAATSLSGNLSDIGSFEAQSFPFTAGYSISGRVFEGDGTPIRNTYLVMTDGMGNKYVALSNSFGYYTFEGVEAGSSVSITAAAKGFAFTPKIVVVNAPLENVDFTPEP